MGQEGMSDQQRDVIAVLEHDHREVEAMFAELESLRGLTGDAVRDRRRDLMNQMTIELVRHSVAEETRVYPAVKEKVSAEEAERAKREHAEAEETLQRLDGLDPEDPSFDEELATLMREIREHVAEEEGEMFPHMRQAFSEEELVELSRKVEAVKKFAPTRPHPSVPNEPGVRSALGPLAGLFDRMRDAVTSRGTED
jgi:hemerythrin superfamily protein